MEQTHSAAPRDDRHHSSIFAFPVEHHDIRPTKIHYIGALSLSGSEASWAVASVLSPRAPFLQARLEVRVVLEGHI